MLRVASPPPVPAGVARGGPGSLDGEVRPVSEPYLPIGHPLACVSKHSHPEGPAPSYTILGLYPQLSPGPMMILASADRSESAEKA